MGPLEQGLTVLELDVLKLVEGSFFSTSMENFESWFSERYPPFNISQKDN